MPTVPGNFLNKLWTIPAEKSKKGNIQKRPLTKEFLIIIDIALEFRKALEIESPYLFVGLKHGHRLSESNIRRINKAFYEMMIKENPSIQPFTPHDFGRTVTNNLSDNSVTQLVDSVAVMPHVTKKMKGHKLGGFFEVYNQHDWLS